MTGSLPRKLKAQLFLIVALGVVTWLLATSVSTGHGDHFKKTDDSYLIVAQLPAAFEQGVDEIMSDQNLSPDELSKIKFVLPSSPGYDADSEFNVFSPRGGNVREYEHLKLDKFSDDPRYIFTFGNNIRNEGTDRSDLIAVLPKVKEFICHRFEEHKNQNSSYDRNFSLIRGEINLTPFPQEVSENGIVTLPSKYGCVESSDGYFYYFHLLKSR